MQDAHVHVVVSVSHQSGNLTEENRNLGITRIHVRSILRSRSDHGSQPYGCFHQRTGCGC